MITFHRMPWLYFPIPCPGPDSCFGIIEREKRSMFCRIIMHAFLDTGVVKQVAVQLNAGLNIVNLFDHTIIIQNWYGETKIYWLLFHSSRNNFIPNRIQQYNTVCRINITNCRVIIDIALGKFDWGVQYVIIFLYEQFWIQPGTVSYRGKKVRTVDSFAVRSVNKLRDTRNCVHNEPKYAIYVLVATRLYYKALGIILCAPI